MPEPLTLYCAGYGYSAAALAKRLITQGWRVKGTTSKDAKQAEMAVLGVEAVSWPPVANDLAGVTHFLVSAGPDEAGDPTLREAKDVIANASFDWVGYLSTTGVYGDHGGGWVDEDTPLTPSTKRGALRVRAEAEWWDMNLPLHIFRLAGIYGPGRGPFSKVRNGTARRIEKPGQVFSRIHRDDIAAALEASIEAPNPVRAYNLCDNEAAPPQDVIAYAAELLGVEPPPLTQIDQVEMSPMAASFYAESKRVSNQRLREELGVKLKHPTYREGLAATLAEESA
ncbi:MAG: SDR family oxidoreductase [Paracoccaceae bacterium]|nr:SDR family oxidoreductase [Paracoccaceae bacterium]MDG1372664.1 SDR family oxidoreductase [Paracoccaceae bacterium]